MFDTIHLWYPLNGGINLQKTIEGLSNPVEHRNSFGDTFISGTFGKTFKTTISEKGISLKGSLAKYHLKDNFQTLSRREAQDAIEELTSDLNIPIGNSKISRIDFAQNLLLNHEPIHYFHFLGNCSKYTRSNIGKSLYYSNNLRQMAFYNKLDEAKTKKIHYPLVWEGKNVLRYEIRFLRKLNNQFNRNELKLSSIVEESFYMELFEKWVSEFMKIEKLNPFKIDNSQINLPKDFWEQIQIIGLQSIGINNLHLEIEKMKMNKTFSNPEYYSRLKKEVKRLYDKTIEQRADDNPIIELENKILRTKRFYR